MRVLCRFTLDELEDFLEAAKEAIPGVREAIDAAHSHKAHQVWQHFLRHVDMQSYSILRRLPAGQAGAVYQLLRFLVHQGMKHVQAASAMSSSGLERLIHLCHGGL